MVGHRHQGSIFSHFRTVHGIKPEVSHLLDNTEIMYRENDQFQLHIFEALHIRKFKPKLNEKVYDFFCLKLNFF